LEIWPTAAAGRNVAMKKSEFLFSAIHVWKKGRRAWKLIKSDSLLVQREVPMASEVEESLEALQ